MFLEALMDFGEYVKQIEITITSLYELQNQLNHQQNNWLCMYF